MVAGSIPRRRIPTRNVTDRSLAIEIEHLARAYLTALAVGEPPQLDAAEMERVLEKFRHYGPNRTPA